MKEDEYDLERELVEREEIVPSSGFVASVMEAVRADADAPAPIPFPWKWALPGLVVSVLLVLGLLVRWIHAGAYARAHAGWSADSLAAVAGYAGHPISAMQQGPMTASLSLGIEWSVMALLVSLAAIWLSMRIASANK